MNKKELEALLQAGEFQTVEFMEGFSGKFTTEMVALTNAEGGTIFLGVNDENEITGIDITNKLKSKVKDSARNCDPPVEVELEEIDSVLAIHIKEGDYKPYRCSNGFYLRQGPSSQKLSRDDFHFPEDFDEERFERYLDRVGSVATPT